MAVSTYYITYSRRIRKSANPLWVPTTGCFPVMDDDLMQWLKTIEKQEADRFIDHHIIFAMKTQSNETHT